MTKKGWGLCIGLVWFIMGLCVRVLRGAQDQNWDSQWMVQEYEGKIFRIYKLWSREGVLKDEIQKGRLNVSKMRENFCIW